MKFVYMHGEPVKNSSCVESPSGSGSDVALNEIFQYPVKVALYTRLIHLKYVTYLMVIIGQKLALDNLTTLKITILICKWVAQPAHH